MKHSVMVINYGTVPSFRDWWTAEICGIENPSDFLKVKTAWGVPGTPHTGSSCFRPEINGIDLDKVAQESMAPNLRNL